MRHLPAIAGALLGLLFLFASIAYFANLFPTPSFPEGSAIAHFFAAFGPTHYMGVVKFLELVGGLFVAIPKTRRLGLLILGPIMVNIVIFTAVIGGGDFKNPMLIAMIVLGLYLVWAERRAFAAYLRGG